jgi:hypothetical protein
VELEQDIEQCIVKSIDSLGHLMEELPEITIKSLGKELFDINGNMVTVPWN